MTIWIIRQSIPPTIENTQLLLPFDGLPDLSGIRSEGDMKRLLLALSPHAAPETIARQAEVHWRNVSELNIHDLILVPLDKGAYALAELTERYSYHVEDGRDVHSAQVHWLNLRVPKLKLNLLKDDGMMMQKVELPEARKQVFSLTPQPYNRFVKWRWILSIMFIMQAVMMVVGMLKR